MGDMPSFAEFASARFDRRLAALCLAAAPVVGFVGRQHQVLLQEVLGWRRVDLGVTPGFLMIAAPICWVVAAGALSWVLGRRTSLSKYLYRAGSAVCLVAGLAGAGVAAATLDSKTSGAAYWFWLGAGLVVAALAALSLWTSRKRLDWQFFEAA